MDSSTRRDIVFGRSWEQVSPITLGIGFICWEVHTLQGMCIFSIFGHYFWWLRKLVSLHPRESMYKKYKHIIIVYTVMRKLYFGFGYMTV